MRIRSLFCAALATFFVTGVALAQPILVDISMTVNSVIHVDGGSHQVGWEAYMPSIGTQYHAFVLVDDGILSADGNVKPGRILGFDARVGSTVWNPLLPNGVGPEGRNVFGMFRGPCVPATNCFDPMDTKYSLGSKYLGFDVKDGEIDGVWGGVLDGADLQFIDFNGASYTSRIALVDLPVGQRFIDWDQIVTIGTLSATVVQTVDEPTGLALLMLASFGLMVSRRSKAARKERAEGQVW